MEDTWGNLISLSDDGATRTYTRMVNGVLDGMVITRHHDDPEADQSAINTFNGMQPE